jgi:CheY-like chemotaxis protein
LVPKITSQEVDTGRRRVLIVEDDDDSRELLGELVAMFGHDVIGASSGGDALEHVTTARPDVALIDIGLPDFDGFEVARRVREALGSGSIRLVALTGYSDRETRDIATKAGFDDYMTKPIVPEVLAELLATTKRAL